MKLIGPFHQLLTFDSLPLRGAILDDQIEILDQGGVIVNDSGRIVAVGYFKDLQTKYKDEIVQEHYLDEPIVGIPGLVDAHTHICFAGSRHLDYAARNAGKTYLEIAKEGGGIKDTVQKTRMADEAILFQNTLKRVGQSLRNGITTLEIKSGYGLDKVNEIKQLEVITKVNKISEIDIVPTCLAAHVVPYEFGSNASVYMEYITREILPEIKLKGLSNRVDVFIEEEAFNVELSRNYLEHAKGMGFSITIHADQFTTGGSALGASLGALSVDHLEASGENEVDILGKSNTVSTVLPGASLGLGVNFAPARKLLDAGAILAIASDWNPGSAPMGDLLVQASILGAYEKLTSAEVLAGLTYRAAAALGLDNIGRLNKGFLADIIGFQCEDYREILYHQGQLKPALIWKKGKKI